MVPLGQLGRSREAFTSAIRDCVSIGAVAIRLDLPEQWPRGELGDLRRDRGCRN